MKNSGSAVGLAAGDLPVFPDLRGGFRPYRAPFNLFFFNDTATTEIYPPFPTRRSSDLSSPRLWSICPSPKPSSWTGAPGCGARQLRSEEHTSELQSLRHLVCRLLLE